MSRYYDTLIVGAGTAGTQVATHLRQENYRGSIGMIGREATLPYSRPPLSKGYLRGEEQRSSLLIRTKDFWAASGIELCCGRSVEAVDAGRRAVMAEDGEHIEYGSLVWAAGGTARRLHIPGSELYGVASLRTVEDADLIRARALVSDAAVIIGGGYIGLEVAASFRQLGLDVTVIEAQSRVLTRVTSPPVSDYFERLHRNAGVEVLTSAGPERIVGRHGRVTGVQLTDGRTLPAQLVLVGVGLVPHVEPLALAGASCRNGVLVDSTGRTTLDGVFAAGDCANRPHPYTGTERVRLESVSNATEQAQVVANTILGADHDPISPPRFWTHQYDTKLQTVGLLNGYDKAVIRGDIGSGEFSVVYCSDGRIIAMDCVNNVRDFVRGKQLVRARTLATAAAIASVDDLAELHHASHVR